MSKVIFDISAENHLRYQKIPRSRLQKYTHKELWERGLKQAEKETKENKRLAQN